MNTPALGALPPVLTLPWRQGRKLGTTIYAMVGYEPSDDDIFLFECARNAEVAEHIVRVHNEARA